MTEVVAVFGGIGGALVAWCVFIEIRLAENERRMRRLEARTIGYPPIPDPLPRPPDPGTNI